MTDPDIIEPLLTCIKDECPGLAMVDEAWFAEPLTDFGQQTPAVLAYLAEDGAAGGLETIRPRQKVTLSYGLWLVCPREAFRPQRNALRSALFGRSFGELYTPMAYRGGQTTDIRGGLIWWREFWDVETWYGRKITT